MKFSELIVSKGKSSLGSPKRMDFQLVPPEMFWQTPGAYQYLGQLAQQIWTNVLSSIADYGIKTPPAPIPLEPLPGMTSEDLDTIRKAIWDLANNGELSFMSGSDLRNLAERLGADYNKFLTAIRRAAETIGRQAEEVPAVVSTSGGYEFYDPRTRTRLAIVWEGPGWYATRQEGDYDAVYYKIAEPYETGDVSGIAYRQGLGTPELIEHPYDWAGVLPGPAGQQLTRDILEIAKYGLPRELTENAFRVAFDMLEEGRPLQEIRNKLAKDLMAYFYADWRIGSLPEPIRKVIRERWGIIQEQPQGRSEPTSLVDQHWSTQDISEMAAALSVTPEQLSNMLEANLQRGLSADAALAEAMEDIARARGRKILDGYVLAWLNAPPGLNPPDVKGQTNLIEMVRRWGVPTHLQYNKERGVWEWYWF